MEFEKEVSGSIADEIRKDREELLRKLAIDDEALAELEPAGGPDLWLEYGAMLGERRAAGSRFSTGLRVFDGKLEGGLYPGVVVAIQGPPAAGKTGLASQIALSLGRAGCAVGALYADEGLSGAAVMLGQQFGAARVPLMAGDEGQAQLAIQGAGALPFFRAMRPSHHSATLEKFAEDFDAIAPAGMQRVWLLDSAQTLRLSSKNGGGKESQFDRIARAVEMVRDLTLSMGAITLLVSRVNRAAYAKKKEEEKADPLGSSWGVALEYFVELLVNLEGKPTLEKPRVALRVSKNRVSASGNFVLPLDMDFPRHGFKEVDPTVEEAEKDAAKLTVLALTKGKIIATLTGRDGVSGRALDKEVGGPAAVVREARRELAVEGKIHERDREGKKGGGKEWFLGSTGGDSGRRPGGVSVPLFGDERETE